MLYYRQQESDGPFDDRTEADHREYAEMKYQCEEVEKKVSTSVCLISMCVLLSMLCPFNKRAEAGNREYIEKIGFCKKLKRSVCLLISFCMSALCIMYV